MEITAISPQKRHSDRFNIYVDGKFAVGISAELLIKNHLKINQTLTKDELNQLIKTSENSKWYNQALNLLSYRPRSQKEIVDYFKRKEVDPETNQWVISKLIEKNLLDDLAFAKWYIDQRQTFRPRSRRHLQSELMGKGVASSVIAEALGDLSSTNEVQQAIKLSEKKLKVWGSLPPKEKREKAQTFLLRRGFSWETVKEVLKKTIGQNY